jgi:ribonuclease VapC
VILDTSAIIAILLNEPENEKLLDKMERVDLRAVSPPILVEAAVVLNHRLRKSDPADPKELLSGFLQTFNVNTVPFVDDHWREAAQAFRRFGKGRHPAKLNLGDCMSYATAKVAGLPLLCLGDDFSKTDLDLA